MKGIYSPVVLGCLLVTCAGCGRGDGPVRVVVSGKVSYRDKPVAVGLIYFVPMPGNAAPTTIVKIADGQYVADAKGGVPIGSHRVKILAYEKDREEGLGGLVPDQYLPPRFNTESEIVVTVTTENAPMTHDFELSD